MMDRSREQRDEVASFLREANRLRETLAQSGASVSDYWQNAVADDTSPQARLMDSLQERVNMLASHMSKQWHEHEEAGRNARRLFDQLLSDTEILAAAFRQSMQGRDVDGHRVNAQIDSDRSVAILKLLWHTISFTSRGNTRPLAMYRHGQEPLFTGRIVALLGDFHEICGHSLGADFPTLLNHEIASLYVPADPNAHAVMTIRHLGDEQHFFHQSDATRQFLLKTVEMVCAGGYFHEKELF